MLDQRCADAVDLLLARYRWQLLDREEFVRRTWAYVRDGTIKEPQRAAVHVYCQVLYAACDPQGDPERQNSGYDELFRYLYDVARWRYADVRAEATQDAIEEVFYRFADCHQPDTFLAFALQCLKDAARFERGWNRRSRLLDREGHEDVPGSSQQEPEAQVLTREQHAKLVRLAQAFLRRHPRAARQFAAVWLKFIEGMKDVDIADLLGVSAKRVHELRSLGLKHLRNDPEWSSFGAELGIVHDSS